MIVSTEWDDTLNVRSGVGTSHGIVAEVQYDDLLYRLDGEAEDSSGNAWYSVYEPFSGVCGWAHSSFLVAPGDTRAIYCNSEFDSVTLRAGPSGGSTELWDHDRISCLVGAFPPVSAVSEGELWYWMSFNDDEGWVPAGQVSFYSWYGCPFDFMDCP